MLVPQDSGGNTHRLLRFVAFFFFLPGVETFRHVTGRKTRPMPCVISWGHDRCGLFGAGARGGRYIHSGSTLAGANGRTTLNDHGRGTRNNLRVIFVLCDGEVREISRVTDTADEMCKRGKRDIVGMWHGS